MGSLVLGLALVVFFLAVSYTSEARAPGLDDETAVAPPASRAAAAAAPPADLGSTLIYLESPAVLAMASATPPQAPVTGVEVSRTGLIEDVNITFYDCAEQGFCGRMSNGELVYEGAAACSWNLPTGTAFSIAGDPTQRIYVCKDRGLLDDTWVDIFWYHPDDGYDWQAAVGRYGAISIVYLP